MNIFVLDPNPVIAAQMACDKHVVKMTLETAQMLSTAASQRRFHTKHQYRPTHAGHPCTKWVSQNAKNYLWAWEHGVALAKEYTYRFNKTHASEKVILELHGVLDLLPEGSLTAHPQAMPPVYQGPDPVEAYRNFYRAEKSRFAKWERGRPKPAWFSLSP